jgi:hypothetical protein
MLERKERFKSATRVIVKVRKLQLPLVKVSTVAGSDDERVERAQVEFIRCKHVDRISRTEGNHKETL